MFCSLYLGQPRRRVAEQLVQGLAAHVLLFVQVEDGRWRLDSANRGMQAQQVQRPRQATDVCGPKRQNATTVREGTVKQSSSKAGEHAGVPRSKERMETLPRPARPTILSSNRAFLCSSKLVAGYTACRGFCASSNLAHAAASCLYCGNTVSGLPLRGLALGEGGFAMSLRALGIE